ncbi:CapA family protein [Cytophagaceae bacterium DM2B3-1]|uniref:CapA family protein n=1 Tax=Xanthocytophaga flava TaxID=3048013 RepID=A0ABT7CV05_9BACT|nr:CapA family protein [Xanthocytophaga flavus]MDJ1469199.1 CapA family protein [Xanthocytophaga flavus]MDJ1497545.1 CapA family protein [Xanthocytophaga flavus]
MYKKLITIALGVSYTATIQAQDTLKIKQDTVQISSDTLSHKADTLTIIGVGDIMMGTDYPDSSFLPPNDGATIFPDSIKTILRNADVTFGNLEGTLLDKNKGGKVKTCSNPAICYAFRTPTRYGKYLVDAGFDMMSLANNHSGDFGPVGRQSSRQTLESNGILYAGLQVAPTTVFVKDSTRYGLIAFAPNEGTLDIRKIKEAQEMVRQLADSVDIVIVSFHGGAEGRGAQHVTKKTELFVGENRGNPYDFAHKMIDAGADVILGHGPHVTRSVDLYKDRFIIYSLGNFCTYGRFSLTGEGGVAPIVKVSINRNGEFIKAEVTPIKQTGEGGCQLDQDNKAIKTLQRLLTSDFPGVPLSISAAGLIERKAKIEAMQDEQLK